MSLNGVCQVCGTIAPIEFFLSEPEHRKFSVIVAELPREVAPLLYHYLSLFKSDSGKAMQIRKATRLATEMKELLASGYVQVDRRVARPCSPRIWALAIEQMIERRDRLTLPMPNHNYLKTIAWDLADKADAKQESGSHVNALQHRRPAPAHQLRGVDPLEKAREEWDKKHGTPQVKGVEDLAKIIGGIGNAESKEI